MSLIKMTESKFQMWRACVAAIWLDGKISKEELKWAKDRIQALAFSPEQKTIIENVPGIKKVILLEKGVPGKSLWEI